MRIKFRTVADGIVRLANSQATPVMTPRIQDDVMSVSFLYATTEDARRVYWAFKDMQTTMYAAAIDDVAQVDKNVCIWVSPLCAFTPKNHVRIQVPNEG